MLGLSLKRMLCSCRHFLPPDSKDTTTSTTVSWSSTVEGQVSQGTLFAQFFCAWGANMGVLVLCGFVYKPAKPSTQTVLYERCREQQWQMWTHRERSLRLCHAAGHQELSDHFSSSAVLHEQEDFG